MERSTETIGMVIARKGIIEVIYLSMAIFFRRVYSLIHLGSLRLRGYDIQYDVELTGKNRFFQNTFRAIRVGARTRFGYSTRIDAGFGGIVVIGADTLIDDYCFITAQSEISIGNHVLMAASCMITDFKHQYGDHNRNIRAQGYEQKKVRIDDNVWIGAGSIILPGVHIGKGAVIGAGSVVTRDVKAYEVVAGNPASPIRSKS